MALVDEATARHVESRPGKTCSVRKACADHPGMAGEIVELVNAHHVATRIASQTFTAHGITIGAQTIGRHRRNDCAWCRP